MISCNDAPKELKTMFIYQSLDIPFALKSIERYTVELKQKEVFTSGIGQRHTREAILIKIEDTQGNVGYGECSCRPDPYFSAEYVDTVTHVLDHFIFEPLLACTSLREWQRISLKIRGWNFAKSAVEMALVNCVLQGQEKSLLSDTSYDQLSHVPVGISLGIQPNKEALAEVVKNSAEQGYKRLKFKVNQDTDFSQFLEYSSWIDQTDIPLSFDANGSLTILQVRALKKLRRKVNFTLEQPFQPGDYFSLKYLKEKAPKVRVCLDESIESLADVALYHEAGLMDELNIKMGRIGGIFETLNIIQYCFCKDLPCWVGGMFETGIGRRDNLMIASLLVDAKAHDLSPSTRYFERDIVQPNIEMETGVISIESLEQIRLDDAVLKEVTTDYKIQIRETKVANV